MGIIKNKNISKNKHKTNRYQVIITWLPRDDDGLYVVSIYVELDCKQNQSHILNICSFLG